MPDLGDSGTRSGVRKIHFAPVPGVSVLAESDLNPRAALIPLRVETACFSFSLTNVLTDAIVFNAVSSLGRKGPCLYGENKG